MKSRCLSDLAVVQKRLKAAPMIATSSSQLIPTMHTRLEVPEIEEMQEESDGTTSSAGRLHLARQETILRSRVKKRARVLADYQQEEASSSMTLLESRSVSAATREKYAEYMKEWLDWRDTAGKVEEADEAIDSSLCRYMTLWWASGHQSHCGDCFFASLFS